MLIKELIAFDAELATPIILPKDQPEADLPGIDYATSFNDWSHMRIAVVCAMEIGGKRAPMVFQEDNLTDLRQLIRPSVLLVSFNGYGFDAPLLLNRYDIRIPQRFHYDLLAEWKVATGKRISLDNLAKANDLPGKSGDGQRAPWDWQAGQYGKIVSYCFNDCFILSQIVQRVIADGSLRDLAGNRVQLRSLHQAVLSPDESI